MVITITAEQADISVGVQKWHLLIYLKMTSAGCGLLTLLLVSAGEQAFKGICCYLWHEAPQRDREVVWDKCLAASAQ